MENIRQHLSYDPATGLFRWLTTGRRRRTGDLAGNANHRSGYVRVGFGGKVHLGHRLAWWFAHGEFPKPPLNIDHVNGNPADNRLANLRLCDQTGNNGNRGPSAHTGLRFKGVRRHSTANVWVAQITKRGRCCYIGTFPTPEAAARAYDAAAKEHFGEFARPNFPEDSYAR